LLNRVNLRIDIRVVRFWRSTKLVPICRGSRRRCKATSDPGCLTRERLG